MNPASKRSPDTTGFVVFFNTPATTSGVDLLRPKLSGPATPGSDGTVRTPEATSSRRSTSSRSAADGTPTGADGPRTAERAAKIGAKEHDANIPRPRSPADGPRTAEGFYVAGQPVPRDVYQEWWHQKDSARVFKAERDRYRDENQLLRQLLGHIMAQKVITIGNPYSAFIRRGLADIKEASE